MKPIWGTFSRLMGFKQFMGVKEVKNLSVDRSFKETLTVKGRKIWQNL